ncbi:peptidoglycan/LPS O-acetylase OafA/YrhL [Neorhizobium galegae]|uniref:acyltransferase family protein n=1 Tax=Neorhizobium galegae TaxID=399 RepID=UPI001AEBA175|nr:acyltransferase [Neorhizobium galegae]MBP2547703.1 peptidoglycan/LPS O-acetylase OafA/YrhL [Neorhizobium galegae]
MTSVKASNGKMLYLEALRGLASIIVVFHHFCLAFLPIARQKFPDGLRGSPLYFVINGGAAVNFFFVLSGFVLVYKFFQAPSRNYLLGASLKRFPRLFLPAAVTILCGFLLLDKGLVFHREAAAITGSEWLAAFAYANLPAGHPVDALDAVRQMFLVFLLPNNFYFNSNLWTMRPEYLGSLAVFAAATVGFLSSRHIALLVLVLCAVCSALFASFLLPFLAGAILAYVLARWPHLTKPRREYPKTLLLIAAVGMSVSDTPIQIIVSLVLICGFVVMPTMAGRFAGPVGRGLGKISFPLYLVHTLVILSLSSYAFLIGGVPLAAVATVVGSALAMLPLIYLEAWWVPLLNRLTGKILAPPARSAA